MYLKSTNIFFPNQIKKSGYLRILGEKIEGYYETIDEKEEIIDYKDNYIIPGFIDQHVHGWGRGSFMSSKEASMIYNMKRDLPYEGVTSFLATSGAEPIEDLITGIKSAKQVLINQKNDGATCLGVHLEGPFINVDFKGMQRAECCINPNLEIMHQFIEAQDHCRVIKLMTIAPELSGAKEVMDLCRKNRIQLSIGHSAASFDCIGKLKELGIGGVSHMFSGMKGLHHRDLGVVGAAMYYDDLYCEFAKQTGMTVAFEAFSLVWKLKGADKIIMTTDCSGMAMTKKEKYHYIRKQTFIPHSDKLLVRGDDGSEQLIDLNDYKQVRNLELSYIKSIQNLMKNVNPTVHEIIKITAENPAKYIGVDNRKGYIKSGYDADLLVVNKDFEIITTYCMGKEYNSKEVEL